MVINEITWRIVPPSLEGAGYFEIRQRAEVEVRKLLLEIKRLSARFSDGDRNGEDRESGLSAQHASAVCEAETPSLLPLTKAAEQKVKDLEDYTGLIEKVAQWLHDETDHPDSYPDHTWPEDADDDGRREGGFVKIVPKHAQEQFRDIARRLMAWLPAEASLLSSHAREAALVAENERLRAGLERLLAAAVRLTASARSGTDSDKQGSVSEFHSAADFARSALTQITEKAE